MKLVLASGSPRRRELLEGFQLKVEVTKSNILEVQRPGESSEEYVLRNASEKAEAVTVRTNDSEALGVLAADTIVCCDGRILEKPSDEENAFEMLRYLSGRQHEVLTGYALRGLGPRKGLDLTDFCRTAVRFKVLSDDEIAAYVATGEPFDKAGGYGIQGYAAYMIDAIEGSYSNIVGLPLAQLSHSLEHLWGVKLVVSGA